MNEAPNIPDFLFHLNFLGVFITDHHCQCHLSHVRDQLRLRSPCVDRSVNFLSLGCPQFDTTVYLIFALLLFCTDFVHVTCYAKSRNKFKCVGIYMLIQRVVCTFLMLLGYLFVDLGSHGYP